MSASQAEPEVSVAVVGAGPRGASILERLCANAPDVLAGRSVTIHLIDPYPHGPGRVWRSDQSALLWLNSTAGDNTIYPDPSVQCEGPVGTGPTLVEWAADARHWLTGPVADEAARVDGRWFPSRRLYSEYLSWMLRRTLAEAPAQVEIVLVEGRAVDLTEDRGRQLVWLEGGDEPLLADVVILAQGHQDVTPTPSEEALVAFADRHGCTYLPTDYAADADLDRLVPGADVLVRGMGLDFVDCMVRLFEGRGGRYGRDTTGVLCYVPSGAEPRLWVGSRRGVPYHAKVGYRLEGPRPPVTRSFTGDVCRTLAAERGLLNFRADLWPRMAADLAVGHYRELFAAHPGRVRGSWAAFADRMATVGWGSAEADAVVAAAVPDRADRLDLGGLDRPLAGLDVADRDALQAVVESHIARDLARRADPGHSADLGMITALLGVYVTLAGVVRAGLVAPRSQADVDGWFQGFFSYVASGPPPPRLEQMLALARAGLLLFTGPDTRIEADPVAGVFRATSDAVPGSVEATALLEARLPAPSVARSRDPLIRRLLARAECGEEVLVDPTGGPARRTGRLRVDDEHRLVDGAGRSHPVRFAMGAWAAGSRTSSGVARPGINAPFFRQNDALARLALAVAAGHPVAAEV